MELANETLRCMHTAADTRLLLAFLRQLGPPQPQNPPGGASRSPGGNEQGPCRSVPEASEVRACTRSLAGAVLCMWVWGEVRG